MLQNAKYSGITSVLKCFFTVQKGVLLHLSKYPGFKLVQLVNCNFHTLA